MGVSVIYSAIPLSSTLYARLQRDKPLAILMASLFPHGDGLFSLFKIDPEEINEIIEWIIEDHQDIFGSDLEADQIIAAFRSELRRTCQAYPGIEDRTISLGKTFNEIEERLSQELSRRQITNAHAMVVKLMFGDQDFVPTLLPETESLGLISHELVSEGARILRQISPETLFLRNEDWEEWCLDNFEQWRAFYLSADEKNEEILVKVC